MLIVFPLQSSIIPGPPFLFGACSVLLALLVALFIPEHPHMGARAGSWKKHTSPHGHPHSPHPPGEAKEPLLQDTNVWLGVLMWLNWPHPLFPIEERTAHGGCCHLLKRKAISEARSVLNLELYLSAVFSLNTPELVEIEIEGNYRQEGRSPWLRLGVPAESPIEHHFLKELYIEEHIFNDGSVQKHYGNGLYLFFLWVFYVALFWLSRSSLPYFTQGHYPGQECFRTQCAPRIRLA